jgi:hypothetical protein
VPKGQKHLVPCRCILPQFKKRRKPPVHQFVVFSVVEDDDSVRQKHVQCNNCGAIHKVLDLGKSEILPGKDHMGSIVTVDDVKTNLPARITGVLERFNLDLPTWEQAQFIVDNQHWGSFVVVASDLEDGVRHGKVVRIFDEKTVKVESFSSENTLK